MKYETKGIGTTWWIEVYDKDVKKEDLDQIEGFIETFEKKYSRFRKESLIYKLNEKKVLTDFPKELFGMLKYCQNISELTDYRFNVCSGSIQHSHGYDENYSFEESELPDTKHIRNGIISLTPDEIKIHDAARIDLGGIGKGWMLDQLNLFLSDKGYKYFSINGGGDIVCTSNFDQPITFYMENPFDTTQYIGTVEIRDGSFACSSPSRRAWQTTKGTIYHHLVDATTGISSENMKAVFTSGKTGLSADTASTCIFISPEQEARTIAEALEVEFMYIEHDGMSTSSKNFPGKLNLPE